MPGPPTPPAERRANRLADAASPYLVQHAHNPVDWYPWGEEALRRAREEDKPIFLSIGYAACHWCHVMERESFENSEIAALMNQWFVNIKVDREERPDLDDLYMTSVQMLTGSGGWPMSVFLTPALEPFFAGTYYPPEDRWGRPGFKRLLTTLAHHWAERRGDVEAGAKRVAEELRSLPLAAPPVGTLSLGPVEAATASLRRSFDPTFGGFGPPPKFPHGMAVQVLLREYRRTSDPALLRMATGTLDAMAAGGLYDHLGGGFHRYSTDERWLVPHFEKMLYDQAMLVLAYAEAHQVTRAARYATVVRETVAYVLRDLTHPRGGFFSSEDADTEGVEGRFYVWTPEEIERALSGRIGEPARTSDAALFALAYGVSVHGNFEGKTILSRVRTTEDLAEECGGGGDAGAEERVETRLREARERLRISRETRVRPFRDEKVIVAWNGLMISALTRAGRALGERTFLDAARSAADFVLADLVVEGALQRAWRDGRLSGPGFADDHAFLAAALLDLYEATFERRWLDEALRWMEELSRHFRDAESGGFFSTSDRHEALLARLKSAQDGSVPSANSVAALSLFRAARLTSRPELEQMGEATIRAFQSQLERAPGAFHEMLLALSFHLGRREEIVVAGPPDREDTRLLLEVVGEEFLPGAVTTWTDGAGSGDLPLHAGRRLIDGRATAYFCVESICKLPLTEPAELRRALTAP